MSVIKAMSRAAMARSPGDVDDLIRAALAAAEREGWRLVPVEPTEDMKAAGEIEIDRDGYGTFLWPNEALDVYRAMLAASPEAK